MPIVYAVTQPTGHLSAVFTEDQLAQNYQTSLKTEPTEGSGRLVPCSVPSVPTVLWALMEHNTQRGTVDLVGLFDVADKGHAEARRRASTNPVSIRFALYSAQVHTAVASALLDPAVQIAQPKEAYSFHYLPKHEQPQSWRANAPPVNKSSGHKHKKHHKY